LSKEYFLFGVSVGDKQDALMAKYKEKDFDFAIRTKKNMHSNYLDLLAGLGITGLLLFVTGFLLMPLLSCFKKNDVWGALALAALMASLLTETYLDRSMGCIVLAFLVSFIIGGHKPATV
jgi:O-antigen ligase